MVMLTKVYYSTNSTHSQTIKYTMNAIWTTLIIASLAVMGITNPHGVLQACIAGVDTAISSGMVLCGVYCFWGGMFSILSDSGLSAKLANVMSPVVRWLYGSSVDTDVACDISANMSANLLGISGIATSTAISAMGKLEKGNTTLSRSGAMLFVVSATSLQLLPTTVMGLRASMGSVASADIVLPTLIATAVTTVLGVLLVNVCYGRAV